MITGESIGDATARLPYKRVQEYGISVSGLPEDKSLKHPSSYGRLTLRQILANKDNITVKGIAMYIWLAYYNHILMLLVSNYPNMKKHQKQNTTATYDSPLLDNNGMI